MSSTPLLTAALAGVPIGIQRQGVWAGRRQLFIRFAGPAETATMYSSEALGRELTRSLSRFTVHSICIAGADALANADYLGAVLRHVGGKVPVMVDTDGQRPEAISTLQAYLQMVQVTVAPPLAGGALENVAATLQAAARLSLATACVISGVSDPSDADYLQVVELAHSADPGVQVILHPGKTEEPGQLDRRWTVLMEHAMARHADVRAAFVMTGPATVR